MEELLECEECHVFQSKKDEFRESQWENPRPVCNTCSTKRAWTMFAADIAACPNARVIHNHGAPQPSTTSSLSAAQRSRERSLNNAAPTAWEHAAAKKIKQELKDANPTSDGKSKSLGDAVRRTKWCAGCNQGVVSAQRCSQCKRAFFCSTACQKTGWLKHKAQCRAISVEPSVAALWSPMLTATRSSNTDESYRAFSTIQAWMASDSTAATVFRGLNGVSMFLQHLESVDLESTWQSLLLITRFVESSADIAEDVVLMGGVATLVSLGSNALDFRIQASAVVAVGSLIASFHDPIALTRHLVNDLDAISALLRVLHQASPLEDDVELVACVQSTAILLQLLEHHPDALSQLATFQTPDEDDVGALLTGLVGRVDTIYRLNRSATKGVPVGHHLYLNLLALTGALVHAYPECKPQFVAANVIATICTTIDKHCQLPPLPNATIMDVLTAWIMWFVWTFIYDWRVRLMTSEAMDILDRLVPLLTPFLSLPAACDDFTANHRGIHLASSVLRHVVDSDANLAPRTRLSALDLFVCAILPPFDVPEADRQRRIEANVDVIVGTLDHVLTRTLAFLDPNSSEKDTTLATMFLAEAVKCTGLVAHFGQAMPPVDHTNLPRTLAQVLQHENVLEDVKWIAMAALIQWDTNGNSTAGLVRDAATLEGIVEALARHANASQVKLIEPMRLLLRRHSLPPTEL